MPPSGASIATPMVVLFAPPGRKPPRFMSLPATMPSTGRPPCWRNGTVSLASYAYDDLSRRTTVTLGNTTTTTYGYDTQSALASLSHNLTGTAQDNTWSYTRNQVQDIKAESWTNDSYQWAGYTNGNLGGDGVWSYAYDLDNLLSRNLKSLDSGWSTMTNN